MKPAYARRVWGPGDDLRYVDWNAYGRLRSLNVKVFEKEENLDALALQAFAARTTHFSEMSGGQINPT